MNHFALWLLCVHNFHAKTVDLPSYLPPKTHNSLALSLFIVKEALGMIRTFISQSLDIETIKGSGFVAYKFFQNWLRVPDRVAGGLI